MVFSFLVLSACAQIPKPDAYNCIVNAPAGNRKCYNFARDYNDDGQLKPGAKAVYRSNKTLQDLNKAFVIDSDQGFPQGLARVKAYIKKLREEYENRCQ